MSLPILAPEDKVQVGNGEPDNTISAATVYLKIVWKIKHMSLNHYSLQPERLFSQGPIIPILAIRHLEDVIPLATALITSGISILEITLSTAIALEAICLLRKEFPDILIGAGSVTTPSQLEQCIGAGAQFAISPGITKGLLKAGKNSIIPFIPGIASISELMEGLKLGFNHFKFFPAEASGGIKMLTAIYGPFSNVRFCPTGGLNQHNYLDYLNLPNVICVGGSWIIPDEAVKTKNWEKIQKLSSIALMQAASSLTKLPLQKN